MAGGRRPPLLPPSLSPSFPPVPLRIEGRRTDPGHLSFFFVMNPTIKGNLAWAFFPPLPFFPPPFSPSAS